VGQTARSVEKKERGGGGKKKERSVLAACIGKLRDGAHLNFASNIDRKSTDDAPRREGSASSNDSRCRGAIHDFRDGALEAIRELAGAYGFIKDLARETALPGSNLVDDEQVVEELVAAKSGSQRAPSSAEKGDELTIRFRVCTTWPK